MSISEQKAGCIKPPVYKPVSVSAKTAASYRPSSTELTTTGAFWGVMLFGAFMSVSNPSIHSVAPSFVEAAATRTILHANPASFSFTGRYRFGANSCGIRSLPADLQNLPCTQLLMKAALK